MGLKERQQLFSNFASKIESLRSRPCRGQNTYLHAVGPEVSNLERENAPIPDFGLFDDPFRFFSNLLHGNNEVDVKENDADQVRTASGPVLERFFEKISNGSD